MEGITLMQTKIYLIRHAKSAANDNGLFGGITDYDLSVLGQEQADNLAERLCNLKIDKIYSSPLKRAIQTISPLAKQLNQEINIVKALIEINVGEWENISRDELRKLYPKENDYIDRTEHYTGMKGQEKTEVVADRMFEAISKIAEENTNKTIVIVSHIVAIRAFLCKIKDIPFSKTKDLIGDIPNTGITTMIFDIKNKQFKIQSIGEINPAINF